MVQFKNAFKCKKCPGTCEQPNGCPVWWEILMTNEVTGEKKVEKGCGFQILPQLLIRNMGETIHGTYAAYDMRNKVVKNMGKVVAAIREKFELPAELEIKEENLQIENRDK